MGITKMKHKHKNEIITEYDSGGFYTYQKCSECKYLSNVNYTSHWRKVIN